MLKAWFARLPNLWPIARYGQRRIPLKSKLSSRAGDGDASKAEVASTSQPAEGTLCGDTAESSSRLLSWEFICYWLVSFLRLDRLEDLETSLL